MSLKQRFNNYLPHIGDFCHLQIILQTVWTQIRPQWVWSKINLFESDGITEGIYLKKVNFEKVQQKMKKGIKFTQHAKSSNISKMPCIYGGASFNL